MDPNAEPAEGSSHDEAFIGGSPETDKTDLIEYYGCAVWYTFYRYGWLYIHEGHLTFEAPWMMYGKFVIRYEDVASITKAPTSLKIADRNGEELTLYLLRNIEETYSTLDHLWKLWISRLAIQAELEIEPLYKHEERVNYRVKSLQGVSDVLVQHRQFKKGFDSQMDSRPPSSRPGLLDEVHTQLQQGMPPPTSSATPIAQPSSTDSTPPRKQASRPIESISSPNSSFPSVPIPATMLPKNANSHKYLLDASIVNTSVLRIFRLPSTETLLHMIPAKLWHDNAYVKGDLCFTSHFLCFYSEEGDVKFIYPFYIIKSFSEPTTIPNVGHGVTIDTDTGAVCLAFDPPVSTVMALWKKLKAVAACLDNSANLSILGDSSGALKVGFADGAVFKKTVDVQFGPEYLAQQKKLEKKWWKYFHSNGIGAALLIKSSSIQSLLSKGGIPDSMRGSAWKLLSGVTYKALVDPMTYEDVVRTVNIDSRPNSNDRVHVEHIIELDLRRSMPEHPYYQCNEGIDALRRVLTAYAFRNPLVSYCQGMNFITSSLLLYMSESDAFWTLAYLCEDVFPELWRPRLFGVRVVQEVMDQLLAERLPAFMSACKDYPPNLALMSWIPTFLVGRVPLEYSLRMLDNIFFYGSDSLYWMLFATLDLMVKDNGNDLPTEVLLSFAAPQQANLDTTTHPFERIFQHAFSPQMRLETLPSSLLSRLATEHKMKLVHELLAKARKSKLDSLTHITQSAFSRSDLELLYAKYHSMIDRVDSGLLSFNVFLSHYTAFFPMWHPQVKLFRVFQASMHAYLGNRELILSSQLHGSTSSLHSVPSMESISLSARGSSETLVPQPTSAPTPTTSSQPTTLNSPSSIPPLPLSESTGMLLRSDSAQHISVPSSPHPATNWNFVRDLFNIFDVNGDGYLSIEEWVQGLWHLFKSDGTEALRICLRLVDDDRDGVVSHTAHRCALGLFLLIFSPRVNDQVAIPQTATSEKLSEWLSIIDARTSAKSRSSTNIEDIIACSFGDVLNILTFFHLDAKTPEANFDRIFAKLQDPMP